MKANRHYPGKDYLDIMDMKIDSQSCAHIQIKFLVDARHILLAITCLTEEEKENPNKKMIIDQLKRELFYRGESWYLSPIVYAEEGGHYNLKENLEKALPIGKKFFPDFFDVPNSIKFIKDLA